MPPHQFIALYKDNHGLNHRSILLSDRDHHQSYTDTYTGATGQDWAMSMLALNPATSTTSSTPSSASTIRYMADDTLGAHLSSQTRAEHRGDIGLLSIWTSEDRYEDGDVRRRET